MHFVQESSYRLHLRTKAAEHREEVAAGEAPTLPVPGWSWLFPSPLPLPSPQLRPAGEEPGRKAEPLALGRLLLVVVVLRHLLLLLLLLERHFCYSRGHGHKFLLLSLQP